MQGNPRVGIDIDARAITPELVEYLSYFGFGYLRIQIAAEDLLDPEDENLAVLESVKERADALGMKLWLVLESRTLKGGVIRDAAEKISGLPGGPPWAVQLFDDINRRVGLPTDRYANLLRIVDAALALPEGHYLLLGGIKSVDYAYFKFLIDAGALARVDAVTLNIFPPQDGIETYTRSRFFPASDLPSVEEFVGMAAALGKEVWIGETGIANSLTGYGVDTFTQAGLIPRSVIILLDLGVSRVTLFTAVDPLQRTEGIVLNFGMIPADLHPRPWGWAMRNWNILTSDLVPSRYDANITWAPKFPATGDTIYHVWFESDSRLALVYWTPTMSAIERWTGVVIHDPGLVPTYYQGLLDSKKRDAEYNHAKNFVVVGNLPLSSIPTVLIFER